MNAFLYVVKAVVHYGLITVQICMFIRALLSWFPIDDDNPFLMLVYAVTEPFIVPFRMLLDRFGIGDDSPIDIAFLMTVILLSALTIFI